MNENNKKEWVTLVSNFMFNPELLSDGDLYLHLFNDQYCAIKREKNGYSVLIGNVLSEDTYNNSIITVTNIASINEAKIIVKNKVTEIISQLQEIVDL